MTTATATTEKEKTTAPPRIAHIYCGPCWRGPDPCKALCGHTRRGKGKSSQPPPDVCVVCTDLIESGSARCPICGHGPLRMPGKGPLQ